MARIHRVALPVLVFLAFYAIAWLYIDQLPLIGQAKPQQYLPLVSRLPTPGIVIYTM